MFTAAAGGSGAGTGVSCRGVMTAWMVLAVRNGHNSRAKTPKLPL